MIFRVDYQQFKYTDCSDNPPLRTWKIKAPSAEAAFTNAQIRAILARQNGRNIGGVRRIMRDENDNLVTAEGDYLPNYLRSGEEQS